jgi:DNA replication protein DnaC
MNKEATLSQLEKLNLKGMKNVYMTVLNMSLQDRPDIDTLMARLAQAELQQREDRKTLLLLKTSKMRYQAVLEDVSCSAERNLTKDNLLALADCSFVKRAENLLITGKTGCGKSFLACAIGRQACHRGIRTIYLPMNKFMEKITLSKIEGSFLKMLAQVERNDLIILDDFGLHPLNTDTRLALLQVLEEFYGRKSVIVTSTLPIAKWYDYIAEPNLADPILDRLLANASRIELKGESMRRRMK